MKFLQVGHDLHQTEDAGSSRLPEACACAGGAIARIGVDALESSVDMHAQCVAASADPLHVTVMGELASMRVSCLLPCHAVVIALIMRVRPLVAVNLETDDGSIPVVVSI